MNIITLKINNFESPTLDNTIDIISNFKTCICAVYGIVLYNISFIFVFICYPNFLTIKLYAILETYLIKLLAFTLPILFKKSIVDPNKINSSSFIG